MHGRFVLTPAARPVRALPAALILALIIVLTGCSDDTVTLSHGRFKHIFVYHPPQAEVQHFALLLSGDGGWNSRLGMIAKTLATNGTLVAGVDTAELIVGLEEDAGRCVSPDGDLENLSHYVQAYYKLPTYFSPILIGHSAGATLAYASLAQAPPGIFAGAVTMSFCIDLDLRKPLCQAYGLRSTSLANGTGSALQPAATLSAPWIALHGAEDRVCPVPVARSFVEQVPGARFVELPHVGHNYADADHWLPQLRAAFASVAATQVRGLPALPAGLADLPIVEVEPDSAVASAGGDTFAVLISGDGGWAGIDKEIAAALARRGIPTAGVDSLRYFWRPRTPSGLAHDVDRIVRYYAAHWHRPHALLIGYSQGADVLPFAVNRLPPATRAMIRTTTLIGVSDSADFEFHVTSWLGDLASWFGRDGGLPVWPEVERLAAAKTVCIYGNHDTETICPKIGAQHARIVQMTGGHHFGGDYQPLAQLILDKAGVSTP